MERELIKLVDDEVQAQLCSPCILVVDDKNFLCAEPCAAYTKAVAAARLAAARVLEGAQDTAAWRLGGYLRDGVRELREGVVPICDTCLRPWERQTGNGPCPYCGGRVVNAG